MQPISKTKRIESIDIVRGIAMVIMALDHVRDYLHIGAYTDDPLNLNTTTPILFFTRFITHYCAPTFVFLSGTSIYLQSQRKTKKELSLFLIKRGLWLIVAEILIISFGWTFNPFYNFIPFQVIWAIGISMVLMGLVIHLPYKAILGVGLLIVLGHNLLDIPERAADFKPNFWWDLLHHGKFAMYAFAENHFVVIVYPFLPWTGLMIMGYGLGRLFAAPFDAARRFKILVQMGLGLIALFVVLRFMNGYGNPFQWAKQKDFLYTVFSFINVEKYPPSLLYMCITIGPALLLLAFVERCNNAFTQIMTVFGRTAFFYYILHIYLIHLICTILFFIHGHSLEEAVANMPNLPFLFQIAGEGVSLPFVYLIWLGVIAMLYPLCKRYDRYKTNHKEKWWLSYL